MKTPLFCLERRCQAVCMKPPSTDAVLALNAAGQAETRRRQPSPLPVSASFGVAGVGLDQGARALLRQIFAASDEFHSCGDWPSAAAARPVLAKGEPCLVLAELALPDECAVRFARELLECHPGLRIILVTATRDAMLLERAAAVGVADILRKPFTMDRCVARLRFVLFRSRWGLWMKLPHSDISGSFAARPQDRFEQSLRPVEKAALECLAEGLLYKQIAERLGRSETAVHKLVHGIYEKLRVHSRAEAVSAVRESGNSEG